MISINAWTDAHDQTFRVQSISVVVGGVMKLVIPSFSYGAPVPDEHCFMAPSPDGRAELGANRSPEMRWSEVPDGTRSFAIVMVDPDAPTVAEDVNQAGRTVAADLPRGNFHHWVLVDIPATLPGLAAGADSQGVTKGGKPLGSTDHGLRGQNDYTFFLAGDPDLAGTYGGYDGPAPPWNDELLHHYHFKLFALDVASLGLQGSFGAADALAAMQGHVLAEAEYVGTYTLNPALRQG